MKKTETSIEPTFPPVAERKDPSRQAIFREADDTFPLSRQLPPAFLSQ